MAEILSLSLALLIISFSVICFLQNSSRRRTPFPVVNAYDGDFYSKRAYKEYETNARELISRGLEQYDGPITISTPSGPKIILPNSLTEWVKSNKDLDHQELVKDDFLSGYSGFESLTAIHHSDNFLINIIKTKLSKTESVLPIISASVVDVLQEHWGDDETWRTIDWSRDTTALVSRAAAAVFVGPELAKSAEWQDLTVDYVMSYFTAVGELRKWSDLMRPLVHLFHPLSRACRRYMARAREMMDEEVARRALGTASVNGSADTHNDVTEWITKAAGDKRPDYGALQLGLAIAALFTTSEALRQTMMEICAHPELVESLRTEVEQAIAESGWTTNALFKMKLLDSVMKEAQRTLPILVGLERKAVRDTVLPSGKTILRGSHLAVDSSLMWSSDVYSNPEDFNARRFLDLREQHGPTHVFTASSREHNTFGMGKHICPGRFFADSELKVCLAQVLLKYDFRFADGHVGDPLYLGFSPIVAPGARVEVRRRR